MAFRKAKACIDHIKTVCTVVTNRIQENRTTFACFIDFQKDFDSVNGDLLLFNLLKTGINGKFYSAIQSIYKASVACVKLNECRLGSSSRPPETVLIHRLHMPLVLWPALPSGSIDYTSDLWTVLLDSWTSPPSGSIDSHIPHNSKCSSNSVVIVIT